MIEVRALDPGDRELREALVRLQRAAYRVEAELIGAEDLPPLHETSAQLAVTEESLLGAFDGERLLGALGFVRRAALVDIHRLAVDPAAFRRGVATRLLDALDALHPDAERTVVATGEGNRPAIELYERRGFRLVERVALPGVRIARFERRNAGGRPAP